MFFDPLYLVLMAPALIISVGAQLWVKSAFSKYSRVPSGGGYSGAQAAHDILRRNGITDVNIEETKGMLSDHYDPRSKTLRLSPDVYRNNSLAALGVAAHEAGHALQHARGGGMRPCDSGPLWCRLRALGRIWLSPCFSSAYCFSPR